MMHLKSWRIESMMEIVKNKEEVKSVMNIIQAFADGKTIQAIDPYDDEWVDQTGLNFKALFERQYRIKPEQKYRPFKDAKECWNEMQKHQPFGWIKCKEGYFNIVYVNDQYVGLTGKDDSSILLASKNSYQDNTFYDGTPFGVKVEE